MEPWERRVFPLSDQECALLVDKSMINDDSIIVKDEEFNDENDDGDDVSIHPALSVDNEECGKPGYTYVPPKKMAKQKEEEGRMYFCQKRKSHNVFKHRRRFLPIIRPLPSCKHPSILFCSLMRYSSLLPERTDELYPLKL